MFPYSYPYPGSPLNLALTAFSAGLASQKVLASTQASYLNTHTHMEGMERGRERELKLDEIVTHQFSHGTSDPNESLHTRIANSLTH